MQHLHHFQRRRARQRMSTPLVKPDFSYDREDFRPLGLQLFQQKVLPSELPLRLAIGAKPVLRNQHPQMVASSAENSTFARPMKLTSQTISDGASGMFSGDRSRASVRSRLTTRGSAATFGCI